MRSCTRLIQNTLVSGGVASAISAAVLSLLAKAEGAAPVQPINATSHWLHGETAGNVNGIDATHTVPGLARIAARAFFGLRCLRHSAPLLLGRAPGALFAMKRDQRRLGAKASGTQYPGQARKGSGADWRRRAPVASRL